jgi:hypothetical protein
MSRGVANRIERQWVSPDEAEALTGRSRWTWRKDAYSGRIGSSKVGRRLFLRLDDVNKTMQEGFRPAVGESATA